MGLGLLVDFPIGLNNAQVTAIVGGHAYSTGVGAMDHFNSNVGLAAELSVPTLQAFEGTLPPGKLRGGNSEGGRQGPFGDTQV